jgi:hypothetical protein
MSPPGNPKVQGMSLFSIWKLQLSGLHHADNNHKKIITNTTVK